MNRNDVSLCLHGTRRSGTRHCILTGTSVAIAALLLSVGCSSDKGDKEPVVTVHVAPVEKTTIQHTVHAQAILFPRQQAAIVPKISAPVRKFLRSEERRVGKEGRS